jgi:caffeoyl-CoA O-methyltransferase
MAQIVAPALEAYAALHSTGPPDHLDRVGERTRRELAPLSGMMVGALEGRFLEMLVFASGARQVLEIGTFSGYSSIAMAAGLAAGGRIVSCELSADHAAIAREHIAASPYADVIEVVEGPALDTVARLPGPFDLVFIDADKGGYAGYLEAVLPKLSPGGVVAVDNTLWGGSVLDDSDTSDNTRAIRAFNDSVVSDPRLVCVQLTVRDGVTLIRKAAEGAHTRAD